MRILTDFTVIPDDCSKYAPAQNKAGGSAIVSFPFSLAGIDPRAQYLHWAFVDDDSIPVCGFQWVHWSVANLPIDALLTDPADPSAALVPLDFSRTLPAMIPEALQGRNSQDSKLVGCTDPQIAQRYTGPNPPDKDHDYLLRVWASTEPLADLHQGFWLNEMYHALRGAEGSIVDFAQAYLTGRA